MKNDKDKYEIKTSDYFVTLLIIVMLLIFAISMIDLNYYVGVRKVVDEVDDSNLIYQLSDEEKITKKDATCLIIAGEDGNNRVKIIQDGLDKVNMSYDTVTDAKAINIADIEVADIIIIDSMSSENEAIKELVLASTNQGKDIILTSLPTMDDELIYGLKEILGIKSIEPVEIQEGAEFLSGFMLGGRLELEDLTYESFKVDLLSTTKRFVVGEEGLPLIWRNIYKDSQIYIVNGPFLESNVGYGILSAVLSQIYEDYVYPVINAKAYIYRGFPYLSNENEAQLHSIYNRNPMQLQQDIILPQIISISRSRGITPSGFLANSFRSDYGYDINTETTKQFTNYMRDIYQLDGEIGIVYNKDSNKEIEAYQSLLGNELPQSIYVQRDEGVAKEDLLVYEESHNINAVIGKWLDDGSNFEYLNEDTVYLPVTIDGTAFTDEERLTFYGHATAFGVIIQSLDIEAIIFPESNQDNWVNTGKSYVGFIDSYIEKFQIIEDRNIQETTNAVKIYALNNTTINYLEDKIELRLDEWYGEAYFIIRTDKAVVGVINGSVKALEDGTYLLTATAKEVDIQLEPIDFYK